LNYDIVAIIVSCLLVLSYYLYLARKNRNAPDSSTHILNARVRKRWVKMIMDSDKKEILAVQTLRNSVLAANFMASTSILLTIGTLNISDKIGQWALKWHPFGFTHSFSPEIWQLKLGLLLLVFSMAFFCFSMAVRLFNHVGYMINLPEDPATDNNLYEQTSAYLNKAGSYYTIGIRSFFFSLPIVLWFFGPYFLIAATLGLIGGLTLLDKVPK